MITPQEALNLILKNSSVLASEGASLTDAAGRVLTEDISAREDLPSFDTSAMDGFAVRTQDSSHASQETPAILRVMERLRAGKLAQASVGQKEAVQIATGASLPQGADAVVMKELALKNGDGCVSILKAPKLGENIRHRGEDVRAGELILKKGTFIRPYEVALLAAQGVTSVSIVRKPAVAILATGDELVESAQKPPPGKIRNSNGPALVMALSRWGVRPFYKGIVPDDLGKLKRALTEALEISDMLLITGGVSIGDFDHTRSALEELGMRVIFWKVSIKPGKPLLFGIWKGKPVFGLPGNPVAALVCLEEFVRPALEKMRGCVPGHPSYHLKGILENDYPRGLGRQQYLFCQARETQRGFMLHVIRPQGSAMLGMACRANALAVVPLETEHIRPGMEIMFRWLK